MSYTPSYNRPMKGNFDEDKAFSQVRAGTDAYLLEDEANEMQAILSEQTRDAVRHMVSSGVLDDLEITLDTVRKNVVNVAPFQALLDGVKVKVAGVNTTQTNRASGDGESNLILMGAKPATGNRTDVVILEVFEEEVRGDQVLFKYGTQSSDYKVNNDLIDDRIGEETSRRVQVKSVVRVLEGVAVTDAGKDLVGSDFTEVLPGLLKSAAGHLAIRLFSVARTANETALATPAALFALARLNVDTVIEDGALPTIKLANLAVTTDKIDTNAVATGKLANLAVTTAKLADTAVTTAKIASAAVTTDKLADGNVTLAKLASDTISNFQALQGLGVPSDPVSLFGFIPVLRFFEWNTNASPLMDAWTPRLAQAWGNEMIARTGYAWKFFEGIAYMSQTAGRWFDKNAEVATYSGWYYADNVSVICLQNTTTTAQTFAPSVAYSSNSGNYSASVAYMIFDPAAKPTLAANFINQYEVTGGSSTYGFTVSVPAGQVVILVLKTCPQNYTSNYSEYYYHNYHGFYNIASNGSFKPHMGTYRRLLTGKWD